MLEDTLVEGDETVSLLLTNNVGECTQNRPILFRLPRWKGGTLRALHPAPEIHIETILLGVGGAR